jgi:hypothetical protein
MGRVQQGQQKTQPVVFAWGSMGAGRLPAAAPTINLGNFQVLAP